MSLSTIIRKYNEYKEKKLKSRLGYCGKDNNVCMPCSIGKPENVFLDDYTLIQPGAKFIIVSGKVTVKKYSSLSVNAVVVTGNHRPTVGINQRILERYHINDEEYDIVIEEDCWVGANVTILGKAHLSRGCVVGANSLVNKFTPPYAVVVGSPARIIASKFTLEQVLEHERMLYPENERMSREELEAVFNKYYKDKKSIGLTDISHADLQTLRAHADMQFDTY